MQTQTGTRKLTSTGTPSHVTGQPPLGGSTSAATNFSPTPSQTLTQKYNETVEENFVMYGELIVPDDTHPARIWEQVRANGASEFAEGLAHGVLSMLKT